MAREKDMEEGGAEGQPLIAPPKTEGLDGANLRSADLDQGRRDAI